MLGIAGGTAFALFVGLGVLDMLTGLFGGLGDVGDAPVEVPAILNIEGVNLPVLQALALVILLGNAAMSAILVRIVDGGTPLRGLQDFTVLVWISHVTAYGSQQVIQSFIGNSVAM